MTALTGIKIRAPCLSIILPTKGETRELQIEPRVTAPMIRDLLHPRLSDMGLTRTAMESIVVPTPTKMEKNPTTTMYQP